MPHYRVEIADARAHLYRVTLTLPRPAAQQGLAMAAWAPGSYTLRDFARHVSALEARQGRRSVALQQTGLSRWVAACEGPAALVVSYLVYAFDGSVRGAFVDDARGFFNGPALFLCAEGHEALPHTLALGALPRGWAVATSMPATGTRRWAAAGHADFIDHPFALGSFWRDGFVVAGVRHEFAVTGAWPTFDGAKLLADTRRICEAHIRFWHGRGRPPFKRYLFLLHVGDDGYGGLEHRAASALTAARRDLPRQGQAERSDGYVGLLALVSHEYFHAWNVTRMAPRDLVPADLSREQPTRLLWFFEGFTSYYDELMLLRAGLVDRARWLRLVAKAVNGVLGSPGRHVQSVAAAGHDAWTKYYRRDENSANATVSYYEKGALVALLTDLALRQRGSSLDDAMRALWQRSGGGPIDEADIAAVLPPAVADELRRWVHGTDELPLAPMLATAGVALRHDTPPLAAQLGLRLAESALTGVQVRQVLRGSAAEAAGLAAGDELIAADGWRLRRLDDLRQWVAAHSGFDLTVARDQRLRVLRVQPPIAAAAPAVTLADDERAGAAALALRRAWLGG